MELEIRGEFQEYYDENWNDYGMEWDEFKDEALHDLYNSATYQSVSQNYHHLLLCLRVIKENDADYDRTFNDWDDPQKIFNLTYYFIAQRYFNQLDDEEAFNHDESESDEDLDEENEEADEEVFSLFQQA